MYVVTGAAGFIGSRIVRALNARGHTDIIVVADAGSAAKEANLGACRFTSRMTRSELRRRIRHDDLPPLKAILHQGAHTSTTCSDETLLADTNFAASVELLELALARRVPFVYASTLAVYGVSGNGPAAERPANPYARSKLRFDDYVRAALPGARSTVVGLRYANVYGPGEAHKADMASMVHRMYDQIVRTGATQLFAGTDGFEDGEQRRDFVHVDDVVRINLELAHGPLRHGIVDLGTGRSRSFNEVAACVIEAIGAGRVEYVPLQTSLRGRYQSFTEANLDGLRALGVEPPATPIEVGVPRAVADWREGGGGLSDVHDFTAKLRQPSVVERLRAYVEWQRGQRRPGSADGREPPPISAPMSINLDLTTACNYRCDHCVDAEILNTGIHHKADALLESLSGMAQEGLRSVILIGGGEPTLHPRFGEVVRHLKSLELQVGIVSNGSRLERVIDVADVLDGKDWVRLSLDAGSDATFQDMHRPRKAITLEQICSRVPALKDANRALQVGFSFIVVWPGAEARGGEIVPNLDEMFAAAELAKAHRFDYISYKPFLERAGEDGAEVIGLSGSGPADSDTRVALRRIRAELDRAAALGDATFRIVESTNLKVLMDGSWAMLSRQPSTCHMTFFRQVVSPLGTFNCPVYRNVADARLGPKDAYATADGRLETRLASVRNIENFDAAHRCREVTCLYNRTNWFIEGLIESPGSEIETSAERSDWFL